MPKFKSSISMDSSCSASAVHSFEHNRNICVYVFLSNNLLFICPLSILSFSIPFSLSSFPCYNLSFFCTFIRDVSLSLPLNLFFLNHSLLHLFVLLFIHLFVSFPSLILTLFLLLLKIFCSFLFLLLTFFLVIHTSILLPNVLPLFNNF